MTGALIAGHVNRATGSRTLPDDDSFTGSADHVIGSFPRDTLSVALVATHRAGFGPQTRVFDGARDDARRQLTRAGLRVIDGVAPPSEAILIVVTAPGRTETVADLFRRLGAQSVLTAARRAEQRPSAADMPLLTPDIRLAGEETATSEA
jgi:hypothetical protein